MPTKEQFTYTLSYSRGEDENFLELIHGILIYSKVNISGKSVVQCNHQSLAESECFSVRQMLYVCLLPIR